MYENQREELEEIIEDILRLAVEHGEQSRQDAPGVCAEKMHQIVELGCEALKIVKAAYRTCR